MLGAKNAVELDQSACFDVYSVPCKKDSRKKQIMHRPIAPGARMYTASFSCQVHAGTVKQWSGIGQLIRLHVLIASTDVDGRTADVDD